MATYSKRAAIQSIKKKKRKELKIHKYLFKAITDYLDKLAIHLDTTYSRKQSVQGESIENIEFTPENINEYASPLFGRDLDSLEVNYLLMKIYEHRSKSN